MKFSEIVEKELWGKKVKIQPYLYCKCQICTQGYGYIESIERPSLWEREQGTQDVINVRALPLSKGIGTSNTKQAFLNEHVELYEED